MPIRPLLINIADKIGADEAGAAGH
jgi:hypothetical protein